MLRSVAEFLLQLKNEEAAKLSLYEISHGPTIGDMYEGLSKELLGRAIPDSLGLQLVDGFVTDGLGGISGQIDCMLVSGTGERIPHTDSFKWHVKNVIAILEVKKTLYGAGLSDALDHIKSVRDMESNYLQSIGDNSTASIDFRPALKAFEQVTGIVVPKYEDIGTLDGLHQAIYHTLLLELVSPVCIILGYQGFQSERAFRRSFYANLEKRLQVKGFGVLGLPQLIISGNYSLCKANGLPYVTNMTQGRWPVLLSSSANPVRLLLEYIWTRLDIQFAVGDLWGEDLDMEVLNPFLLAKLEEKSGQYGWNFEFVDLSDEELAAEGSESEWEPVYLTEVQFEAMLRLINNQAVSLDDPKFVALLDQYGVDPAEFREQMLQTSIVSFDGPSLRLVPGQYDCVVLPTGEYITGDNQTGRLARWLRNHMDKTLDE